MQVKFVSPGLKQSDLGLLPYFCLTCGSLFDLKEIETARCNACGRAFTISTETLLTDAFYDAPQEVRDRIIETIERNWWRLQALWFIGSTNLYVQEADERLLPSFCIPCGELLSQGDFYKRRCSSCCAPVTKATNLEIQREFQAATEETKLKILRGIAKYRVRMLFFQGHTRTTISP